MNDIEQKALALLNEVRKEQGYPPAKWDSLDVEWVTIETIARAIEAHEAFRQEVSDAVEAYLKWADECLLAKWDGFDRFILPKPDPLVEAMKKAGWGDAYINNSEPSLRAALDALGFEIREKGQ